MKNIPQDRIDAMAARIRQATHLDAAESVFFARELLQVRTQAFEVQYPEFEATKFVPVKTDIDPAIEEYTYQVYDSVGKAELVASYSTTAPRADVHAREAPLQKIRGIVSSYGYSFQEMRASMLANKQLDVRKANAARRSIAQEVDEILAFGSTKLGATMRGILTLPGTETYAVPNGAAGSKTWASKTPDEILADMYNMELQLIVNSNNVERPDTLLLPLSSYGLISQRRIGDGSSDSILAQFKKNCVAIKNIEPWYLMESAPHSEWTGRRAMAYRKDPEKLEALLPVEFEQFPPQIDGFETKTNCHARIGGVVLYFPKSVIYADGI